MGSIRKHVEIPVGDPQEGECPDGYIWLQDDEEEGSAECGCTVYRAHKGSGPALILCPLHAAAPDLLAALKSIRQACKWQGGVTYKVKDADLEVVRAAIAKAEEGR